MLPKSQRIKHHFSKNLKVAYYFKNLLLMTDHSGTMYHAVWILTCFEFPG